MFMPVPQKSSSTPEAKEPSFEDAIHCRSSPLDRVLRFQVPVFLFTILLYVCFRIISKVSPTFYDFRSRCDSNTPRIRLAKFCTSYRGHWRLQKDVSTISNLACQLISAETSMNFKKMALSSQTEGLTQIERSVDHKIGSNLLSSWPGPSSGLRGSKEFNGFTRRFGCCLSVQV